MWYSAVASSPLFVAVIVQENYLDVHIVPL